MDPKGRCVLNLRRANGHDESGGTAEVLNEHGAVIATHHRRENSMEGDTAEILWEFENIIVEFSPRSWEVCFFTLYCLS